MIGPTDLLSLSLAPSFKTLKIFLMFFPKFHVGKRNTCTDILTLAAVIYQERLGKLITPTFVQLLIFYIHAIRRVK